MMNKPEKTANTMKADCPVYKKCGGCQLQNLPYAEQLSLKQRKVIGLLGKFCHVDEIIGMADPYHYRNKVSAAFGTSSDGKIIAGVYQSSTHRIVDVDNCLIEDENAGQIIKTIKKLMLSFKLLPFDEKTGRGFLRHVLIRRGFATNQIMVVFVTASPQFPKKQDFIAALLNVHPDITTIVQNLNYRYTSMVLGERETTLYGKGVIEDVLCGCRFRISPRSFYQINPLQTEILYGKAMEFAALTGRETVFDAYCGVGTIGLVAAKNAKDVFAAELNPDAVKNAKQNARLNNTENIRFVCEDAAETAEKLAARGARFDVVFIDPPRAGCAQSFLKSFINLAPEKIVYISCSPETQARDMLTLAKGGYRAKKIQPVDMFPHTAHVECVVLLSHKSPNSHVNVNVKFGEGEGKVSLDKIAEWAKKYQPNLKVTYKMIQEFVENKYGFKVHSSYIAEIKKDLGLPIYDIPNAVGELKQPRKHPTSEKVEAIKDALRYFGERKTYDN